MDIIVEVCPVPLLGQEILKANLEKNITELKSYDVGTDRLPELPNKANEIPNLKDKKIEDKYDDSILM